MGQLNIKNFNKLRRSLASLFLTDEMHQSFVTVLNLREEPIEFSSISLDTWTSIVSIADQHDKIKQLLDEALHRRPNNKDLLIIKDEIEAAYLQNDMFEIHYAPYNGNYVEGIIVYEPPLLKPVRKLRVHLSACMPPLKVYDWMETEQTSTCQFVLMLLTPELRASKRPYFSWAEKIRTEGAWVIPVLIKECDWKSIPVFMGRSPLPKNEKFLNDDQNIDAIYRQISAEVCRLVNTIQMTDQK